MKIKSIYISNSIDHSIKNIETINITDVDNLSNGSFDTILCDCLDTVSLKDRDQYLNIIIKKLKINGVLITKNINLKVFAKHIIDERLNINDANIIIENIKSLIDDDKFFSMIANSYNIKIIENIYNGMNQTITIKRVS